MPAPYLWWRAQKVENVMRHSLAILIAVVIVVLTLPNVVAQKADQADVQLKAAIQKEVVDGDLKGAIELYNKVAQSSNRAVAARALVRMGQCYEKLGDAEARKAYERVVREFADQKEAVEQARALLAAGSPERKPDGGIAVQLKRVLPAGRRTTMSHVSPDGRFIPFTDGRGNVWLHDLTTGEERRAIEGRIPGGEWATVAQVSPDSGQIAYAWAIRTDGRLRHELRVADVNGSGTRTLMADQENPPLPKAWSPDGKRILILQKNPEGFGHSVVSVADGSVKALTMRDHISNGCFSPDGRYIVAYRASTSGGQFVRTPGGLTLIPVDGSPPVPLFESSANNWGPFWSPDGRRIVFLSDRSGTVDLWSIRTNGGRAEGEPELLKQEAGSIDPDPIGFTRDGLFYYKSTTYRSDVYSADLDPATGLVVSKPVQLNQRYVGSVGYPMAWSPDGQFLAYARTSRRELGYAVSKAVSFVVRSEKTGEEREIAPLPTFKERQPFWLFWLPDGRTLLADDTGNELFFHQFDVRTGQAGVFPSGIGSAAWYPVLSPDANTLFYVQYSPTAKGAPKLCRVMRREMASGEARDLYRTQEDVELDDLALSPDGRQLAFVVSNWNRKPNTFVLMVMPSYGGAPRELLRSEQFIAALTWTRDGRHLLTVRNSDSGPTELWSVPVDGGEPQLSGLPMPGEAAVPHSVALHPDGRRIAFSRHTGPIEELWVIKNLLPTAQPPRR
jgi:Tol biopolymer transport system component